MSLAEHLLSNDPPFPRHTHCFDCPRPLPSSALMSHLLGQGFPLTRGKEAIMLLI